MAKSKSKADEAAASDVAVQDVPVPPADPVTETTALAAPADAGANPLAAYDPAISPCRDAIPKAISIPVMHVFQDAPKEKDRWGDHPKGTILESVCQEVIVEAGKYREFVLINRTPEMILTVWAKKRDGQPPVFTCQLDMDKPALGQIPPEYLTQPNPVNGDPGGRVTSWDDKVRDLQVRLNWCYVALFAPDFDEPIMMMYSWTSEGVGRAIESKEKTRKSLGKAGAMWRLGTRDRSNDQGEWKSPTCGIAGSLVVPDGLSAEERDKHPHAIALRNVLAFYNGIHTQKITPDWGEEDADG